VRQRDVALILYSRPRRAPATSAGCRRTTGRHLRSERTRCSAPEAQTCTSSSSPCVRQLDAIHRIVRRDRSEIDKRRPDRQREMLAAARGDAHILTQYWRSLLWRHRNQPDPLPATVGNRRIAICGRRFAGIVTQREQSPDSADSSADAPTLPTAARRSQRVSYQRGRYSKCSICGASAVAVPRCRRQ